MAPEGARRVVAVEVAELAVEVQAIKGEHRLLESRVDQALQVLTSLVHDVQQEQGRAREDRMQQIQLLQELKSSAAGVGGTPMRVHDIEKKLDFWRGVVVGFGILATTVAAGSTFWIMSSFDNAAKAREAIEKRLERLEVRP